MDRFKALKAHSADLDVCFEVSSTLVLGLGTSGLRTGPLAGFAADPPS